jgi:integrase
MTDRKKGTKENGRVARPTTWPEVLQQFTIRHIGKRCKSDRSKELHYIRAKRFCDWAKSVRLGLDELDAWEVDTYLSQLLHLRGKRAGEPLAPGTVNGHWRLVKTLLRWCARNKIIPEAIELTRPSYKPPDIEYLTKDEQARLLALPLSKRNEAFVRLALDTGIRREGLLSLDWRRLEFDPELQRGTCRAMGKGCVPYTTFFACDTWAALQALRKEYMAQGRGIELTPDTPVFLNGNSLKPWSLSGYIERLGPRGIEYVFQMVSEKLGFKVTPHKLRHTAGRNWALAGMPAQAIQRLLNHSSLKMTERYTKLVGADVANVWQATIGAGKREPGDFPEAA